MVRIGSYALSAIATRVIDRGMLGDCTSARSLRQGRQQPVIAGESEYEDVLGRANLWVKSRLSAQEREELLEI